MSSFPISLNNKYFSFFFFKGHVVMGTQAAAVHQQVIERTKGIMYRTQMVTASIDKKLASKQQQPYSEPFAVRINCLLLSVSFQMFFNITESMYKFYSENGVSLFCKQFILL